MMNQEADKLIRLASEIARRYQISSLKPLMASCRAAAEQDEISIALVGRFKAGKSSFLNHFLGKNFLPVGVVPVTAVITEVCYGTEEKAATRLDELVETVE